LLFLADEGYGRAALFVAQQRVDAVVVLRYETGRRVLLWYKSSSVDDSRKLPITKDQRILHRRQFLIQANLVFVEIFAADKPPFVICLFRGAFGVGSGDFAALNAVAADLFESRTSAVDEDY